MSAAPYLIGNITGFLKSGSTWNLELELSSCGRDVAVPGPPSCRLLGSECVTYGVSELMVGILFSDCEGPRTIGIASKRHIFWQTCRNASVVGVCCF